MPIIRNLAASVAIFITALPLAAQQRDTVFERAFPNRLIFSETPEIGFKWKPGLRFWISGFSGVIDTSHVRLPVPLLSLCWNAADLVLLDIFLAGYPTIRIGAESGSFADNFGFFTIKSRPLDFDAGPGSLKAGWGLKFYWAKFHILDSSRQGMEDNDGSFNPFLTVSYFLLGRHYFNLSLSTAIRRQTVTWNIIPGYRCFIGRQRRWSLGAEYYLMNPAQLPIKIAQYAVDPDDLDFYNPDQYMISYLAWGVSYSLRSFRVDTYIANYIDFSRPFFPFIGFGWNF